MSAKDKTAKTYIVCSVVLCKDDKYLLVQEKKPEVYGKWNLPGGRVDKGETLEQAATREAKEEVGFDVKLDGKLLILHQATELPILHAYKAKIIGGKLKSPKDEILDARWFLIEEIRLMKDNLRNPEFILEALGAVS